MCVGALVRLLQLCPGSSHSVLHPWSLKPLTCDASWEKTASKVNIFGAGAEARLAGGSLGWEPGPPVWLGPPVSLRVSCFLRTSTFR